MGHVMNRCFPSVAEKPFFFFPDSIHQVVLMALYNLLVIKKEAQVVCSLLDSGRGQASILH